MKLISIGIFFLFMIILICGCNINSNQEINKLIGTWHGKYYGFIENQDLETKAIFYQNDTVKTIFYQIDEGEKNQLFIEWADYKIEDDKICFKKVGDVDENYTCASYRFSNNYSTFTINMSISGYPDFVYVLTKSSD